jgi:ferritin-like metal-binding protein YciE
MSSMPAARARIEQHITETQRHAELVKSCIERLGGDVSAVKTGIANITGMLKEVPMAVSADEIVKNTLADYASEHFEIACYTSLIAAAQVLGDQQTLQVCQQILREEIAMAQWLEQQIPVVTQHYLGEQVREHGA